MFGFSLQLLSKIFVILGVIQRDIVINVKTSSCSAGYSCRILMKLQFSGKIFEKVQVLSLMKISPVRAELFHADGWT
jgi:hypothetical protein